MHADERLTNPLRRGQFLARRPVEANLRRATNVQALQQFSHEELAKAFDSVQGEPSLWPAWLTHARRIRAESIRL